MNQEQKPNIMVVPDTVISPVTTQTHSLPLLPGHRIQSSITYELAEKIGVGGMGEVYKAKLMTNLGTSEVVALKKIRNDLVFNHGQQAKSEMLESFRRETSIIAELNGHPNIVGFRGADIMEVDGTPQHLFFVMEYINGFDLTQFMDLHRISIQNILDGKALMIPSEYIGFILFKVANALHHAHTFRFSNGSRGIAHMDLSPGNILINSQLGLIKISDFGIATNLEEMHEKLAKGIFLGKPLYMAPELLLHNSADFRVDFYSLGVIMYQLLTGINPNRIPGMKPSKSNPASACIAEFQKRPLIPPHQIAKGVDEQLSTIVMTLMEFKRENRYSSARKLRDIIGQTIYKSGYGPTDHAFALYLTKLRMIQMINAHRDSSGEVDSRKIGRREYDQKMLEMVEIFDADAEPLWLHGDAIRQLANGANPCRS